MMWYRVWALLLKYWYISINRFERIFDLFYWPMLDILIWGFMSTYIQKLSDINLIHFIFGAIILWVIIWRSSQDITMFILEDFWSRNLYNFFSTPVMVKELVISLILVGIIRAFIVFLFLSIVAYTMYQFSILILGWLWLPIFVTILLIFAWSLGLVVTGFILRYGQRIQIITWSIIWIIQPFSCVFYPLSALPQWAQNVANFIPTTHIFENVRALIGGTGVDIYSIVRSFIIAIILFVLAAWFFYGSMRKARKSGLLAKND